MTNRSGRCGSPELPSVRFCRIANANRLVMPAGKGASRPGGGAAVAKGASGRVTDEVINDFLNEVRAGAGVA